MAVFNPSLTNRAASDVGLEHLAEFQTDVAAANDDQVFGQGIDIHDARIGEVIDMFQTRNVGYVSPRADVDEDLVRSQQLITDTHRCWTFEPGPNGGSV